jgi:hypothetical protein
MLTGEESHPCEIQPANINVSILAYPLAPYSNLTSTVQGYLCVISQPKDQLGRICSAAPFTFLSHNR